MSKAVLLSLQPQWLFHIIEGKKIYEVRKRAPKLQTPFKVYIYCTLGEPRLPYESMLYKGVMNGLVCAEFTCSKIIEVTSPFRGKSEGTCLTDKQLAIYASGEKLYFWEVSEPKLLSQPMGIGLLGVNHVPQSWQYIEME